MTELFGIHDEVLQLRVKRARLLANHIVNADTPGFKAADIDFKAALAQALPDDSLGKSLSITANQNGHLTGFNQNSLGADLVYRVNVQPTLDGNTVDANVEKAQYMRNAQRMQATLRFLEDRVNGIRNALRGD